ncbi:MAG: 4Fe-4S binding protein [Candidatus Hydrogenedentota bacterium]|nr:MAG: 4Fe-4S binding protein [Candidatus Hydrogenedentota bacterium]
MTGDIFRTLQERLDKYSLGFPATESGIEIKILKELFSDEDAAMFLELTPEPESPESIASRIDRHVGEAEAQLEDMTKRGLLFRLREGDSYMYCAIPFVHGVFEFQVMRLGRKLSEMMEQYLAEKFEHSLVEGMDAFIRTIPVQYAIDPKQEIASYEDVCEILRSTDTIVLTECACRKQRHVIDQACDKPLEACFMFGAMGQYYLDHDMGRKIDSDEAIRIVTEAQKAGLVTQPGTSQNPGGMCNCCGDCCGFLRSLNKHPKPAEMVFSNHYAEVDVDTCTGCEACVEICQMDAVKMINECEAEINLDRCIGCGLCVTACPTEALQLTPKPEEKRRTPPATGLEQMKLMAQKRGLSI